MSDTDQHDDDLIDDDFLLDDIADLPALLTPPTGAYLVSLENGVEEKDYTNAKNEDKKAFYLQFKIKSVVELNEKSLDEGEEVPKEGDIFSMLFNRTQTGVGFMKPLLAPVAEQFGVKRFSEIKEKMIGIDYVLMLKRTYNKKADRQNIRIVKAGVA